MNMCIFEDCGLDAIYCEGHAREVFAPSNVDQEKRERARECATLLRLVEAEWCDEAAALLREAYSL